MVAVKMVVAKVVINRTFRVSRPVLTLQLHVKKTAL